jgi:glucose/arabinose dehydrogenase
MNTRGVPALALAALLAAGCNPGRAPEAAAPACLPPVPCAEIAPVAGTAFASRLMVAGLASPVHLAAPDGDLRLFVVEQGGTIRIVEDCRVAPAPFLDISGRVLAGGERGLLSVAFHPGYALNGRLFVHYTARAPAGQVRISEFRAPDPAGGTADPGSETVLLAIDHPLGNHNGGQLAFGPDGLLYAGVGDGGGAGDPNGNAQDPSSPLGKLLRLDPDSPATPVAGNPFGNAVYHLGLRNPWRFSFDRLTGDLYVGDVGQGAFEEVDFAASAGGGAPPPPGTNWGWNALEGFACFEPPAGCDAAGKTPPIVAYPRAEGTAVTGGFVYRGRALPDLAGTYFYADYGSGFVRTFRAVNGVATEEGDATAAFPGAGNVSSFGEDGCGELYVVSHGGEVRKLVPPP